MAANAQGPVLEQIDSFNEMFDETKRFCKIARAFGDELEVVKSPDSFSMPSRAAAVRASLDLTRALAKWRRGR